MTMEDRQNTIALIRNTFKGRTDVVPKFWKSKRDGKTGYSPLCKNEWDKKLCKKPCQKCKNADYIPLSDDLVKKHLSGEFILGTYPLLDENSTHFLAGDFDKHKPNDPCDPYQDVKKYYEVCDEQSIPCYILRSKSGCGYHTYIFFDGSIPAWKSRLFGFGILEKAGLYGAGTEKSSFDRFFPNQVRLTRSGFGNLIALPFQKKARSKGHTVFLSPESDFKKPYKNQLEVLENIQRTNEAKLDQLIKKWKLQRSDEQHKKITEDQSVEHRPDDYPLAVYSKVMAGCRFLNHCKKDAETLPEQEWYIMLSIVARCKDGRRQCHKLSDPYPKYSEIETNAKIEHAIRDAGPYTCQKIKEINSTYCDKCPNWGKIASPIVLGLLHVSDSIYEDIVMDLNKSHAVVMIGGKCAVMNITIDPVFNRPDLTFSSKSDFLNFYANKEVADPEKPNKVISIADVWFKSPNRKEYKGIIFNPGKEVKGYFNLWQGFAIEPKKGDWSLYQKHIETVIANNNRKIAKWVLAWMARIVQDPGGKRPGTSIVLRGKQGTGKGVFVNTFGALFGNHFLQLTHADQVTGRFNSHLKDALLVFVDEGFWAGNKQAEGIIKAMITEDVINIEQKGKDIFKIKNNINLIIASNHDWIVPAGLEERRFFVLDMPDTHIQDHDYFQAVCNQMENGGFEAMLFDLLNMDKSNVDLRLFERTDALLEQITHSMSTVKKWWLERLINGNLTRNGPSWGNVVPLMEQYDDYVEFAKNIGDRYPKTEQQFGIEINKVCPNIYKAKKRFNGYAGFGTDTKGRIRKNAYEYPGLEFCRESFEDLLRMKFDWNEFRKDDVPF